MYIRYRISFFAFHEERGQGVEGCGCAGICSSSQGRSRDERRKRALSSHRRQWPQSSISLSRIMQTTRRDGMRGADGVEGDSRPYRSTLLKISCGSYQRPRITQTNPTYYVCIEKGAFFSDYHVFNFKSFWPCEKSEKNGMITR